MTVVECNDYDEFVKFAGRLTEIGFRWNTGHKIIELYSERDLFEDNEKRRFRFIKCNDPSSGREEKPALIFSDNVFNTLSTDEFLAKPKNYALKEMKSK